MSRRDAGFTLLEILVALVVLGFVMVGLSQGLRFGLHATERQERNSSQRGDLLAVDGLLRRLVVEMDPGTSRTPAKVVGDASAVSFTTDLGAAARALPTTNAEVHLGLEGGRLVLRWRPVLQAVRFAPPPPPKTETLLDRVDGMQLAYWGSEAGHPAAWHTEWRESKLPLLVRIRLIFPAVSGRRWPDIVTGPARPTPPS